MKKKLIMIVMIIACLLSNGNYAKAAQSVTYSTVTANSWTKLEQSYSTTSYNLLKTKKQLRTITFIKDQLITESTRL